MPENQAREQFYDDPTEFYQTPEPLHPDLDQHLRDGPAGKMIHHPLLINILIKPGYHKVDNVMYRDRKEQVEQSWRDRNWSGYVALHERPYRAEALHRILSKTDLALDPHVAWQLIKTVWIDSENVHEHDRFWNGLWKDASTELTLNLAERKAFHELPDPVPVWHGLEREDERLLGLSWTTDRGTAEWFAHRFARSNQRPAFIASGVVSKENIRAYLLGRGEQEVIAFPEDVIQIAVAQCKSTGRRPYRVSPLAADM